MADKNLDSSDLKKQEEVDDITTCCICTEVYTDPKALPCIHTFCMKCIQKIGLSTNKGPGDEMPCPICRRLFKIPPEGFPGLPKHFFIERLIKVSQVSDQSATTRVLCSLCLQDNMEEDGKETPTASTYCVDCKQKLCDECYSEHRIFKATRNHKLMPISEYESGQNMTTDIASTVCEVQEQKVLDVYCRDCKVVVGAICFIEEHDGHKGFHVDKCVDGFRKQIENNTDAINQCISLAQNKLTEFTRAKEEMQRIVDGLEYDVGKRKDEMKQLTDNHAGQLLQVICTERQSRFKEIQMSTDDVGAYLSNLESYNSYCRGILAKGSASDICRALSDLSIRAFELQQECQPMVQRGIPDFKFRFRQSEVEDFVDDDCGNLVGNIEEEGDLKQTKRNKELLTEQSNEIVMLKHENDKLKQELSAEKAISSTLQADNDKLKQELTAEKTTNNLLQADNDKRAEKLILYEAQVKTLESNAEKLWAELETMKAGVGLLRYSSNPVFVQTIKTRVSQAEEKPLRGLSILEKELFVMREGSSEVEVYDSVTFNFIRIWNLEKLIDPINIVSCDRNNCLYIVDSRHFKTPNEILKIDPNGKLIKNWSTGDYLGYGISVTEESNVILTIWGKNKLKEYSPDGQLIREIDLSSDNIKFLWHAIKLASGQFLISHGFFNGDLSRVCLVDADGQLKKSFGGKSGSATGQMNRPVFLSVDRNGFVMVVDRANRRVLLLDSDLKLRREILSKDGTDGIRYPEKILHDESNGRLFVADNSPRKNGILTDVTKLMVFSF